MGGAYVYLLQCSDGTLYCGSTRKDMDERLSEHMNGHFKESYAFRRRPVSLLWCEYFAMITDAIDCERRLKGWSKAKKLAMIKSDWKEVSRLAKSHQMGDVVPATSTLRQAQGEVGAPCLRQAQGEVEAPCLRQAQGEVGAMQQTHMRETR